MKKQQPLIESRNPKIGGNLPLRRALLSCLGFAFLIAAQSALADSFVWTGGGGNTNWNNPANWQNVTPGGTHTFPDGNDNVTFSMNATVGGGNAANISIGGSGTLSLALGSVGVIGGTINNQHILTFSGSTINDETLVIQGSVTLNGGGEVQLVNSHSRIVDHSGGTLTNVDNLIHGGNGGRIEKQMINSGTLRADNGVLTLTPPIDNTAGSVQIFSGATLVFNSIITGGTLAAQAGSLVSGNGILDGVTNTGTTTIAPGSIGLLNSATNQGKITFSGSNINDETLLIYGSVTLNGGGEVQLVNSHSRIVDHSGGTLTNVDNLIHGGNGGRIEKQMINSGTLRADNGVLTLTPPIDNTAGSVQIFSGATLVFNSIITGGALAAQAGSLVSGNGILDGVTNTGTTTIAPGSIGLLNSATNQGKITFSGSNINDETLLIYGSVTLNGGGEVQLVNSHSRIVDHSGGTLTNVDNLIHGGNGGRIEKQMINSGNVFADNGTLNLTNTFAQTGTGTISVLLNGPNFTTSGLLAANNVTLAGTLKLVVGGTFSANVGATYRIITASTLNGTTFDTVDQSMTNGYTFNVIYGANFVDIGVVSFVPPTPTPTPTATPPSTPSPTPPASPTPSIAPSATPSATPASGKLGNISTRLRVETGDNVLIGGFIVTGTQPKRVILRAVGPSLTAVGVPDALANPTLELHDSSGLLASNDNWMDAPNRQEIIDTTIAPTNDFESAILMTLPANSSAYTAIMRGVNNSTGVGLVEAYDLDLAADSKLANISTRGFVQTGDNVMIGGFIVVGQGSTRVIVRAIGPSLSFQGALVDPTLELRDGNGALLQLNDNWRTGGQEAEIIATTIPPSDDLESALVRTLAPGSYTAIVRGVGDATGVGLIEVYDLGPP